MPEYRLTYSGSFEAQDDVLAFHKAVELLDSGYALTEALTKRSVSVEKVETPAKLDQGSHFVAERPIEGLNLVSPYWDTGTLR